MELHIWSQVASPEVDQELNIPILCSTSSLARSSIMDEKLPTLKPSRYVKAHKLLAVAVCNRPMIFLLATRWGHEAGQQRMDKIKDNKPSRSPSHPAKLFIDRYMQPFEKLLID